MVLAPIVVAITVGLIAGTLRGGRLRGIFSTRIHGVVLYIVALAAGFAVDQFALPHPGWWIAASLTAGLVFSLLNLRLVGMAVVSIGVIVNLVPVALNGATPVRGEALVSAGLVAAADLDQVALNGSRVLADDQTILEILGDVIPVRATKQVLSFGDLIMLVGLANVLANLMVRARPRWTSTRQRAMTRANPLQDWGIAPPPTPRSPSQYSANPDCTAPWMVLVRINSARRRPAVVSSASVARHSP